jgi:hypothetical protein
VLLGRPIWRGGKWQWCFSGWMLASQIHCFNSAGLPILVSHPAPSFSVGNAVKSGMDCITNSENLHLEDVRLRLE